MIMVNGILKLSLALLAICGQISSLSTQAALENVAEDRRAGFPHINQNHPGGVKFLRLISTSVIKGPGFYGITKEEATSMAESLYENIKTENSQTNSVGVTAGVSYGPASLEVSANSEWTNSNSKETETQRKKATYFASKTVKKVRLTSSNQYLLKAAELKMFVFKNEQGKTARIIVPTGQMHEGPFTPEDFTGADLILDDSFKSWNDLTIKTNIKFWTHRQIEKAIKNQHLEISTMIQKSPVDPKFYYQIKNIHYKNRIGITLIGEKAGCPTTASLDQTMWKIEQDRIDKSKYHIINKNGHHMLTDGKSGECEPCEFGRCNWYHTTGNKPCKYFDNGIHCNQPNKRCPNGKRCWKHKGYLYYSEKTKINCDWMTSTSRMQLWTIKPAAGGTFKIATAAGDELAQWGPRTFQCGPVDAIHDGKANQRERMWEFIKTSQRTG